MYNNKYFELKERFDKQLIGHASYNEELKKLINSIIVDIQEANIKGLPEQVKNIAADIDQVFIAPEIKKRFDNLIMNELEIAERKTVLKSKMRVLYCAVTSYCNVKCIMCSIINNKWELPDKAVSNIIESMPYLENVIWQGGEVFLYKNFTKLMDAAGKHKVNQKIVTNGLLLNESVIDKLISYNVDFGISIDGLSKDVYEYIRVGGDFDVLINNLKLLKKCRSNFVNPKTNWVLNVLVMKKNINQIEYFPEFAAEYGFSKLCINAFGPDFLSTEENIFHYNKNIEFEKKIIEIKEILNIKCKKLGIELFDSLPDYSMKYEKNEEGHNSADSDNPKPENNLKKNLFCQVPWRMLFVDSDGTVRPECFCDREHTAGDISENTIDEIWNNEVMQEYRKNIINNTQHTICKTDCLERRIPEKVLNNVVNPNMFWWEDHNAVY